MNTRTARSAEGSDCFGTVCAALNAMTGRERRVTADALYRTVFTEPFTRAESMHAVFFLDEARRAVHVSGYMGDGLYMNESSLEPKKCGTPRTYNELRRMYPDFLMVRRTYGGGTWE
mgnify:CR=1 FL=1